MIRFTTCLKGIDHAVLWPFSILGLTSDDGRISHSKSVTLAIVLSYFVHTPIPLGVAIVVCSSSYGIKMFGQFLDSKTATSHEELRTVVVTGSQAALLGQQKPDPGA